MGSGGRLWLPWQPLLMERSSSGRDERREGRRRLISITISLFPSSSLLRNAASLLPPSSRSENLSESLSLSPLLLQSLCAGFYFNLGNQSVITAINFQVLFWVFFKSKICSQDLPCILLIFSFFPLFLLLLSSSLYAAFPHIIIRARS